jgi:hypothetical protein
MDPDRPKTCGSGSPTLAQHELSEDKSLSKFSGNGSLKSFQQILEEKKNSTYQTGRVFFFETVDVENKVIDLLTEVLLPGGPLDSGQGLAIPVQRKPITV